MMSHREFGTHLRQARRARRLTQAQAATRAGVGIRLWNEAENGRRAQVGLATMLQMLGAVGVELQLVPLPVEPGEPGEPAEEAGCHPVGPHHPPPP